MDRRSYEWSIHRGQEHSPFSPARLQQTAMRPTQAKGKEIQTPTDKERIIPKQKISLTHRDEHARLWPPRLPTPGS
ncbi:hypothetical protein BDY21DRAFT_142353 [Lineolata rhizophorae]|uniref:Uncharacterized protein n=1 Tax=Lineolata rhizophorae TaxID=578093 RepID=A0A6A6NPF9_9PEZI|nr:hypothetical protein BDY21DRAFT_142353 [Lineolata rhizophorae]